MNAITPINNAHIRFAMENYVMFVV
jgi:hypothetical protein